MSVFNISNLIKFLGERFFIWSIPTIVVLLNFIKGRELLEENVLLALFLGLTINFLWKICQKLINKKEPSIS